MICCNGDHTNTEILIPEIARQKVQVSSILKTCDMSDILALIEYMQFSIGQFHFRGFAFLTLVWSYAIYVIRIGQTWVALLAR